MRPSVSRTSRRHAGFTFGEFSLVLLFLLAIGLVGMPMFVRVEAQAQVARFESVRGTFALAVRAAHQQWRAEGAEGERVSLPGTSVFMNAQGWPRCDPLAFQQQSGADLYRRLLRTPLPEHWSATTSCGPAQNTGVVVFTMIAEGGGSFAYDLATGLVR